MSEIPDTPPGMKRSERDRFIVNKIRHLRMDPIKVDVTVDSAYLKVYLAVMDSIAADYPSLSREVQRQVAKKKRWQARRSNERVSKAG